MNDLQIFFVFFVGLAIIAIAATSTAYVIGAFIASTRARIEEMEASHQRKIEIREAYQRIGVCPNCGWENDDE